METVRTNFFLISCSWRAHAQRKRRHRQYFLIAWYNQFARMQVIGECSHFSPVGTLLFQHTGNRNFLDVCPNFSLLTQRNVSKYKETNVDEECAYILRKSKNKIYFLLLSLFVPQSSDHKKKLWTFSIKRSSAIEERFIATTRRWNKHWFVNDVKYLKFGMDSRLCDFVFIIIICELLWTVTFEILFVSRSRLFITTSSP